MTISYRWLSTYLPVKVAPERLSVILTSIGLEVESMNTYAAIKGGLKGLVIGEVLECVPHPNAGKLKVTTVDVGSGQPLQIVCGAMNVAAGQKVVVATAGTTIYPLNGAPVTMKVATIRNVESYGMICAEDEIGLGESHEGIMVLPSNLQPGSEAAAYFQPYEDIIYEIGLTPNRMDAMSHMGVARDVCAYLTHHDKKPLGITTPFTGSFVADHHRLPISVSIENAGACQRYSGVSLQGVTIAASPKWLQDTLKAIGLRPVNNVVDITNYVLHETGQPLHAFDADAIKQGKIIVKNLPEGTLFTTLDDKERKLSAHDLMICNAEAPMAIGGVFGGLHSGITTATTSVFLESAWFNPVDIRKTSFRHNLRTDAAIRFEKGVDISNTVNTLIRAAQLIKEIAGGTIASGIVDVYPSLRPKTEVTLQHRYLTRLSGKHYPPDDVTTILQALGFETIAEGESAVKLKVPYHKPDISLPADIVEEVLRIDGFDNIAIPAAITITPAVEDGKRFAFREKVSAYLTGSGFHEIMTNSITNSSYFSAGVLKTTVGMINSLSADLNVMRPSMLETGLQAVAYNINRRNTSLQFFEFGKTYHSQGIGHYEEREHLCLYATGNRHTNSWRNKSSGADFYFLKGIAESVLRLLGIALPVFTPAADASLENGVQAILKEQPLLMVGKVSKKVLERFDIRQPVYFADLFWEPLADAAVRQTIRFTELPKQLPVERDLAVVVHKSLPFDAVQQVLSRINLPKLQQIRLFDVFESEKLGPGKKSMAINLSFLDEQKTLNDKEIDSMMHRIIATLEQELEAEIRK